MERLSFAKDHEYGIDVIPGAKKDKKFNDIIGHTWLTHVKRKDSSLSETGYVLWHSLDKEGNINKYDVHWSSGKVETDISFHLLEGVKDSKIHAGDVHEHETRSEDQHIKDRKYKNKWKL